MSPRAKKTDQPEATAVAANGDTQPSTPKRRGRPRKSEAVKGDEAASESAASETAPSESVAPNGGGSEPVEDVKPKRRGRPRKTPIRDDDAGSSPDGPSARGQDTTEDSDQRDERERRASRADRDADSNDDESSDDDSNDDSGDDSGDDGSGRKGGRGRRSRRSRGGGNQQRVNYRDLQTKILPELHLLAKESGLEDYRAMEKDDLAIAILERMSEAEGLKLVQGYLEISSDGYGFLQASLLQNETRKVIVSAGLIKQFRLRTGDWILGKARPPRNNERYGTLIRVEAVNGVDPFQASKRPRFDDLTPTFPEHRIKLETKPTELSARVIDLLAPIGRGQRGLIVAPPKAGKTTLLKAIAHSVVNNEPDIELIVLLVDERPEEVTDFRESVVGVEVVASTFDEPPTNHIRVAEFVHERARRIVEDGGHVMILLDSITRLARANNLVTPPTGRTLSGGLDSSALHWPKRFLGAARNIRGGGSLSILATALVETGSRMDDVIFEEFKGTGNMELHLSRRLEERRIFPAIDILKSGTRREDLLLDDAVLAKMWLLRKVISDMDAAEAMEMLLSRLSRTKTNEEFLSTLGQG